MNLKLQEKDASALFLALDEIVNFDLKKFSQDERESILDVYKKVKKYKSFTLKQAGYKLLGGNRVKIGNKVYQFYH